ncbi:MAG: hypothetical protein FD182_1694 [Fusobacteria bacterium]|nr:MAG: hypothetical protein FD182_1694 [Fusobacteriota bacterium]
MLKLGTKVTEGDMAGSSIKYRSYIEGSGWQDWKVNGTQSGELNKRVETINISLEGAIAAKYDVYYSVHVQDIGWMGWAKNGENAGTSGYDYRIEAMKVVLVTKGAAAPGANTGAYVDLSKVNVAYKSSVQSYGYQPWKIDGAISGITGMSLRMEAWMLKLGTGMNSGDLAGSNIKYRSYVEGSGWQDWKVNGTESGELNKRVETINISLEGPIAANYDVYYSVHVQNIGWMGWAKNGENAGTSGYDYRIEAMKVVLVTKGAAAPGATTGAYVDLSKVNVAYKSSVQSYGYQPWKTDGAISGITGMSLRLEAWMLKLGTKMTEGDMAGSSIKYRSYIEGSGWQDWKVNGTESGELNKRVERINIGLEGAISANILQCSCAKYRLDGLGKKRRKCRHVRIWV